MKCLPRRACCLLAPSLSRVAARVVRPGMRLGAALGVVLGVGLLAAGAARAEVLRLRSGEVLDVEQVEVQGETLRVRLRAGGGSGRASLPFARIEPADLLRVLAPRTGPGDAAGHLRLSRVALEAGQLALALEAALRAATLDPALAPAWADVQAAVQARLAQDALHEVELDLRLGRPAAARERARALLEQGLPVVPPPAEAAKARLLLGLCEAALQAAAAAPEAPPAPAAVPAPGPAAPPALGDPATLPSAVRDADALVQRGLRAREEAALPGLAAAGREARLVEAATRLLEARRLLLDLAPGSVPGLGERLEALRAWLVATWLDLADLARAAGQPGLAFERVQAALVLDPASERAWELRRWIEQAWAQGALPPAGPVFVGGLAPGAGRGLPAGPAHGGGVRHGSGAPGGAVHNPGTRR